MVVYVAGPYRAKTPYQIELNIAKAKAVALEVWKRGHYALCPHTNTANFDGELPDEVFLEGALELLRRCDAIVLVDGWEDSEGTIGEIAEASKRGMKIYKTAQEVPWLV